jgi:hypothetical protein
MLYCVDDNRYTVLTYAMMAKRMGTRIASQSGRIRGSLECSLAGESQLSTEWDTHKALWLTADSHEIRDRHRTRMVR